MPEHRAVIRTRRLDLVVMWPELMRALVACGWGTAGQLLDADIPAEWRGEDWRWLGERADRVTADPSGIPWLPRVLLLRAGGDRAGARVVVGEAGFHGPPDGDGRVEIGYMVVSQHRRQGYAEEAVRALMSYAAAEHGITRFQACINPGNTASLNLIRRLGFTQAGRQHHDRRGEELVFHRDQQAGAGTEEG